MITWNDDTAKQVTGNVELQLHSSSCWTAGGPASPVGSCTITDSAGRDVPDPLNAVDGCFDPNAAVA